MLKKLHIGINEEAYHHKELVKSTWENANFDTDENNRIYVDLNNMSDDSEEETITNKREIIINKIQDLLNEINNTKI
jgi:hypothetical protein